MSIMLMLAFAMPVAAQADESPDAKQRDQAPVACIYRTLGSGVDRDVLADLARKGFDAKSAAEKRVMVTVAKKISDCERGYGWGAKSKDAATRFFTGRVLVSNARYQLRDHGVTTAQFGTALDALTPEAQQNVVRGSITGTDMGLAWKTMVDAGAKLDAVAPADRGPIAQIILQGLAGAAIMAEAEAAFRAR